MPRRTALTLLLGLCVACGGGFRQGAFYKGPNRYNLGKAPAGFDRLELRGNDLAFVAPKTSHLIAVNSTCDNYEDAPLEVLTNHLLMGFRQRTLIAQDPVRMDGRESLQTHLRAEMDGAPM